MKRKMIRYFNKLPVLILGMLLPFGLMAQKHEKERTLSGTVKDADSKEPLRGVTLSLQNQRHKTQTNEKGAFRITIPADGKSILHVQLLGYFKKDIPVESDKELHILLEKEQVMLDEAVAIGYATVDRKDLTGAVSSLNQQQLKDIPVNSAAEALTGKLAGVQVTTSEGTPGADVQIKIRGGGSITQDNSPLYIIDGIQVENGLSSISPQDIESVDVLKDASSTAIYGARGANGVVIITTKGGREMNAQISYNNIFGKKSLANKLDVMDPYNFVIRQYERTRGLSNTEEGFEATYGSWNDLEKYKSTPFVDWQEQTFGNDATMQTHNLSLTGGTKAIQYNLSLSSNQEDGVMLNSGFDRKLINFRFDDQVSSKLKVGFNTRYNTQSIDGAGTSDAGSNTYNMLRHTIKYRPLMMDDLSEEDVDEAYYDETNSGNALGVINPVELSNAQYQNRKTRYTNFSGYANYVFSKQFSFRSSLGINRQDDQLDNFDDGITSKARTLGARLPMIRTIRTTRTSLDNSNVLTFKYKKSNKHQLDVLLGNEIYTSSSDREENQLRYFPDGITPEKAFGQLNLGAVIPTYPLTYQADTRTISFFNRINYGYKSRYLASFSLRADASSRFSEDKRWGYFPSGSFAWRISEEKFMKNIPVISDLKLRLSYGTSGNDRIDDYLFLNVFNSNAKYALNEQLQPGLAVENLANKDLLWETTVSRNIGLDVSLFNDRLQLTTDIYYNKVNNLLLNVPVPTTSGYTTQLQNVGNTSNKGLEIQLNALAISRKNFSWNSSFNISFNRNRIDKLSNQQQQYLEYSGFGISGQPADYVVKVGQPVGTMYGYVSDGFYTLDDFNYDPATSVYTLKSNVPDPAGAIGIAQPGWMKLKDLDGNNVINEADKTIIGNANPKFSGGLNQQFAYKNFDMSIFVNFVYGNKVYNANKIEFTNAYTSNTNSLAIVENRWRTIDGNGNVVQQVVSEGGQQVVKGADPATLGAINKNASLWIPISGAGAWYPTSWAMEDGSFLRINNITLGYTLPQTVTNKVKISKFRIYATVNNLAVITGYSGYDPEVNTRRSVPTTPGVDYSAYPRSKVYILGLNLTL